MATALANSVIVLGHSPNPQATDAVFNDDLDQHLEPQSVHLLFNPTSSFFVSQARQEKRTPYREVLPVDDVLYAINSHRSELKP